MTTPAARSLLVAVLAAPALAVLPAPPAAGDAPPAEVELAQRASVGQFGVAVVHVHTRCRPGLQPQELAVEVEQGDELGHRSVTEGLRCDGAWHRTRVEVPRADGGPYAAAPADVVARLTVADPVTQDPLPRGVDAERLRQLPAAEVHLGDAVRLHSSGAVEVPVYYRCQRPWLVAGSGVEVVQGDRAHGLTSRALPACDGGWHRRVVVVDPSSGAFRRGPVDVRVQLDVEDREQRDPVDQATDADRLWAVPPGA